MYAADLESGLHYLLRVELATRDYLEGEELSIFKDLVTVVAKVTQVHIWTAEVHKSPTTEPGASPPSPPSLLPLSLPHPLFSCIQVEDLLLH